jgi:hypothetical protein
MKQTDCPIALNLFFDFWLERLTAIFENCISVIVGCSPVFDFGE